jgi:hypothetical protein
MDYLQKCINKFQLDRTNIKETEFIKFIDIVNHANYNSKYVKYDQIKRIIKLIRTTNDKIKAIYSDDSYDKKTKYNMVSEERQDLVEYIGKIQLGVSTMIFLLSLIERKEYSDISKILFNTLFGYPNTEFFKMIIDSKEKLPILVENDNGDITIYNQKYTKNI